MLNTGEFLKRDFLQKVKKNDHNKWWEKNLGLKVTTENAALAGENQNCGKHRVT